MRQPFAQPDAFEFAPRALEGIGDACELERHRDILDRGHGRNEMERLKDDPDIAATETCERVFVELW